MISLFFAAFVFGLIFNAAPGAVFAETVRRGIRGGFRPALAVQLGSLAGDTLWALLGLSGVGLPCAQAFCCQSQIRRTSLTGLHWAAL